MVVWQVRRPTGDYSNLGTWYRQPGDLQTSYYLAVDEVTLTKSDYCQQTASFGGQANIYFTSGGFSQAQNGDVLTLVAVARATNGNLFYYRPSLIIGGIEYQSDSNSWDTLVDVGDGWTKQIKTWDTNPKSDGAWLRDDLLGIGGNSLDAFGVRTGFLGSVVLIDVAQVYIYIGDYTDGEADEVGIYPTDAITRLTGYKHIYRRGQVYRTQHSLGGLANFEAMNLTGSGGGVKEQAQQSTLPRDWSQVNPAMYNPGLGTSPYNTDPNSNFVYRPFVRGLYGGGGEVVLDTQADLARIAAQAEEWTKQQKIKANAAKYGLDPNAYSAQTGNGTIQVNPVTGEVRWK